VLMGLTHLFWSSQVSPYLLASKGATTVTVVSSSLSPRGMEPLPKKAHLRSFRWVSSQYTRGVAYCLCGSCFSFLLP
jgi:hypothetical protein